jgi:molybdopterin synthase sulfur carrier subunit
MPVIKFYAGLRKATGSKETTVYATSLQAVLEALLQRYPALQDQVWDGTTLRPHIIITINGQHIDPGAGLNIPLEDEDQVALFPLIAGG